jgi:serine/alanine adding enzyme
VRKAEKAGVAVAVGDGVGDFVPLYEETMRRAGASPFYFFAPAYWDALARAGVVRFEARVGGEIAASALCLASPPWLHYHLGASSDAGRTVGAMHMLFLEAARWARERGYERFHLGGGVGGAADSLHEFKRRFDPGGLVDAAVGKAIHDEAAYGRLAGTDAGVDGFFPAYRRLET